MLKTSSRCCTFCSMLQAFSESCAGQPCTLLVFPGGSAPQFLKAEVDAQCDLQRRSALKIKGCGTEWKVLHCAWMMFSALSGLLFGDCWVRLPLLIWIEVPSYPGVELKPSCWNLLKSSQFLIGLDDDDFDSLTNGVWRYNGHSTGSL